MAPSLPDSTLAFLREGYPFISARCDALGTDVFTSRIAFRPVTFIRGAEAAGLFYEGNRFTRQAAMPPTVQHLLQDKGSVQGLDGQAHAHRKRAFLGLMTPDAMTRLGDLFEEEWRAAMNRLASRRGFRLLDVAREVLVRAVCRWSDVPLPENEVRRRTHEFALMIDQVAHVGPGNWYAQWRRRGTERWIAGLVEQVRSNRLEAAPGTALEVFAHHRENGELISPEVAAVEIINILRPTLALANFVVFAALALDEHPEWREAFAAGDESDLEPFVQEVRRYYPFFPAVPGRVVEPFEFGGHSFARGEWVILDLYGTCHDRRIWQDPESFSPERFRGWSWEESPNTLIAQGAGRHLENHRCPGEWSTVELLKRAARLLSTSDLYLPAQDRTIPLDSFPSIPHSGVILAHR
ncbi:cytochrome P450 [Mobilicoccus massiliensis]|uniref:cytochrome P450 n=1 Tax=Mobilicoccus massiliensis TaxID=1522310 RepID=UPI00058CD8DC|nr:cytochrome P450 [Mobilicoccus massiliensis]